MTKDKYRVLDSSPVTRHFGYCSGCGTGESPLLSERGTGESLRSECEEERDSD